MAGGRPKVALILTDDERVQLTSLAHRSRTAPHVARRARIILTCAEGIDNRVVAKRLRMSEVTVCKWRARFIRERLDGLYDEPRPGAPRQISDEQIEQVIVRTLEATPRGETHWSSRGLARATGLGRTTIQQIWRAFGLQPHRTETFKLSTDPLLIDKVRDIVGLYMQPPTHAVVSVSMRSREFRRWTARNRSCRCDRGRSSGGRMITDDMGPPRCLPRST
jgi:transposase